MIVPHEHDSEPTDEAGAEVQSSYPTMMRYAELEGPDKDLLLMFLWELERRKMICSKLELSLDGKSTERVWYGND